MSEQWFNVSEKLPEHNQDVLMWWESGVVMLGKYFDTLGFSVKTGSHYSGKVGVVKWRKVLLPEVKIS